MGHIRNPITLEKGLRGAFMKAFQNGENPQDIMPLVMVSQSNSDKEKYGWLGQVPQLREWADERHLKGLIDFDYEIPNKNYEATLKVDRNDLEDDQLGGIQVRINDLAARARTHIRKLFYDAINAGETDLCYDGQAFFSVSHEEGDSGTQSNLLTGAGTTLANIKADFEAAESAMMGYKDDQGEPYNEGDMDLYVVCSETLKPKFNELRTSKHIDNSDNSLQGRFKMVVSSRLTEKNSWYLCDASGTLSPLISQTRRSPEFNALEANSEQGFMRRHYLYGIDYRQGFGYGLWQKMIKIKN